MIVALLPIVVIVLALGFAFYCLRDMSRAEEVYLFSREVWTFLLLCTGPFGGMFSARGRSAASPT